MDRTNSNTAIASAIVEELARCGMRRAVVCPGSRSAPLALAFERNEAIEVDVVIDERSAGFLALGQSVAGGTPVGLVTTSGSAVANLLPAVVEADEASVGLICLTADRPPELRDIGAGQTIDQLEIFGSAVRWFSEMGVQPADDNGLLHARSVACRAWSTAAGDPRPGPVHLNIAFREPLAPVEDSESTVTATGEPALEGRGARPLTMVLKSAGEPDPATVEEVASAIAAAERPLLLAGMNHRGADLAEAVGKLAGSAGMPILAEPTSQLRWGILSEKALVSAYDLIARAEPESLTPDLVIRIGDPPTSKALRNWIASQSGIRQLVIDPIGSWKEPSRSAETVVRADPRGLLTSVAERLTVLPDKNEWLESWSEANRVAVERAEKALADTSGLTEPGVWLALAKVLSDGDRVLAASSMPVRDLEAFMPVGSAEVRFFANRGANGIDGQIATAAGISTDCLGTTYAVIGDLALAHDLGSLQLLADRPRLKLVVVDNGGGGIFDFLPVAELISPREMERLFTTPSGLRPEGLARGLGLAVARPTTPDDLVAALQGNANFIYLETDRASNLALHRSITDDVAALLS